MKVPADRLKKVLGITEVRAGDGRAQACSGWILRWTPRSLPPPPREARVRP